MMPNLCPTRRRTGCILSPSLLTGPHHRAHRPRCSPRPLLTRRPVNADPPHQPAVSCRIRTARARDRLPLQPADPRQGDHNVLYTEIKIAERGPAVGVSVIDGPLRGPLASDDTTENGSVVPASPLPADSIGQLYGLSNGQLYFQRCRWCRTPAFRRLLCPICACSTFERERSNGIGFIRRITGPGNVAVVAMTEGFWLRSTVISQPGHPLRIGAQVQFATDPTHETQELVFRISDSPHTESIRA